MSQIVTMENRGKRSICNLMISCYNKIIFHPLFNFHFQIAMLLQYMSCFIFLSNSLSFSLSPYFSVFLLLFIIIFKKFYRLVLLHDSANVLLENKLLEFSELHVTFKLPHGNCNDISRCEGKNFWNKKLTLRWNLEMITMLNYNCIVSLNRNKIYM